MLLIENMIDNYINWLKEKISIDKIGDYYEIITPFVDRNNDSISIYATKTDNDKILLTDGGEIINDLIICGIDITQNRKNIISNILSRFGITLTEDYELVVTADKNNFPIKKHLLIQAILAVNDLFLTSREQVTNIFFEEIGIFLEEIGVRAFENFSLMGKSGFTHNFDYAIPKSDKYPERLLKGINRPNKDNVFSVIFSWNDVAVTRASDSKLLVFLNDSENDVSPDLIKAFLEYEITPINWSERYKYRELLCA